MIFKGYPSCYPWFFIEIYWYLKKNKLKSIGSFQKPIPAFLNHAIIIVIWNYFTINIFWRNKMLWCHMKRYRRPHFRLTQILCYCLHNIIKINLIIQILCLFYTKVNFVILFTVVFVEWIIYWNLIADLLFQNDSCFISPTSTNIFYCIASSTQQNHGNTKAFHVIYCLCMTFNWQI